MKKIVTLHYRLYLLLLFGSSLFCCKEKVVSLIEKEKLANTGMFEVQLRSWSFLGKTDFLVVYNNLPNSRFERGNLIVIKNSKNEKAPDTLKLKITKEQEDSIFYYAIKYLYGFKISDDKDTAKVYNDGHNFSLSFEGHNHKKLEVTKYRTAGFKELSDEAAKLVAFINRIVPESFRVN